MQLPREKKNVSVQEAADMLNVRRERIWKLLTDGVLTAEPSKLDARQKLIPREQVERLLLEEGYRPRRTIRRINRGADVPESERVADAVIAAAGQTSELRDVKQDAAGPSSGLTGTGSDPTFGSALNEVARREDPAADPGTVRRLPRTIGVVEDESFQASESEAYMHEHRDHGRVNAE